MFETANYIEAAFWIAIGVTFFVAALRTPRDSLPGTKLADGAGVMLGDPDALREKPRRGRITLRLRRALCLLAALAFTAFGASDIIEARTGAWWQPSWLLAWKLACIVVLLALLRAYYAARAASIQSRRSWTERLSRMSANLFLSVLLLWLISCVSWLKYADADTGVACALDRGCIYFATGVKVPATQFDADLRSLVGWRFDESPAFPKHSARIDYSCTPLSYFIVALALLALLVRFGPQRRFPVCQPRRIPPMAKALVCAGAALLGTLYLASMKWSFWHMSREWLVTYEHGILGIVRMNMLPEEEPLWAVELQQKWGISATNWQSWDGPESRRWRDLGFAWNLGESIALRTLIWHRRYAFPILIPFALLAIPAALIRYIDRPRPKPGYCLHCGYNLTGNASGRCPECGTVVA